MPNSYKYYKEHIAICDREIERQLQEYQAQNYPGVTIDHTISSTKSATKNKPKFNTCGYLKAIYGVDVMAIYGISDFIGLEILSEMGTDISKWETSNIFYHGETFVRIIKYKVTFPCLSKKAVPAVAFIHPC